jgi:hypothetical protein
MLRIVLSVLAVVVLLGLQRSEAQAERRLIIIPNAYSPAFYGYDDPWRRRYVRRHGAPPWAQYDSRAFAPYDQTLSDDRYREVLRLRA